MQYYKLSLSCATKDTGSVYPQIQKMKENYDYKSSNSIYALSRCYKTFPEFEPDLDGFVLHGWAKPTDLLSNGIVGGTGFLLSGKAKNIFEKSNLTGNKFFEAKVFYKRNNIDYYWMHFISNVRECVNYQESKFYIFKNFRTKLEYIDVDNEADIIRKEAILRENNPGQTLAIWAELIKLNSSFDDKLDFFKVGKFDSDYYVSERLRKMFEEQRITGIEFEDATNLIISN